MSDPWPVTFFEMFMAVMAAIVAAALCRIAFIRLRARLRLRQEEKNKRLAWEAECERRSEDRLRYLEQFHCDMTTLSKGHGLEYGYDGLFYSRVHGTGRAHAIELHETVFKRGQESVTKTP